MANKEEDIDKTNTTPFVYGDVVYWKVFIDPSFIENEEVSNKKFAMLKVTFPGQFRTHCIREAACFCKIW